MERDTAPTAEGSTTIHTRVDEANSQHFYSPNIKNDSRTSIHSIASIDNSDIMTMSQYHRRSLNTHDTDAQLLLFHANSSEPALNSETLNQMSRDKETDGSHDTQINGETSPGPARVSSPNGQSARDRVSTMISPHTAALLRTGRHFTRYMLWNMVQIQPDNLADPSSWRPDTSSYSRFADIFLSTLHTPTYGFRSFRDAFEFGKRFAQERCGFQLRIKTTGVNRKEGMVYKYVCCQRQGLPEHGWKIKGERKRKRDSVRCNCRWSCRLIGAKPIDAQPDMNPNVDAEHDDLSHEATDMIWVWERSDNDEVHNHALHSAPLSENEPYRVNGSARFERRNDHGISTSTPAASPLPDITQLSVHSSSTIENAPKAFSVPDHTRDPYRRHSVLSNATAQSAPDRLLNQPRPYNTTPSHLEQLNRSRPVVSPIQTHFNNPLGSILVNPSRQPTPALPSPEQPLARHVHFQERQKSPVMESRIMAHPYYRQTSPPQVQMRAPYSPTRAPYSPTQMVRSPIHMNENFTKSMPNFSNLPHQLHPLSVVNCNSTQNLAEHASTIKRRIQLPPPTVERDPYLLAQMQCDARNTRGLVPKEWDQLN